MTCSRGSISPLRAPRLLLRWHRRFPGSCRGRKRRPGELEGAHRLAPLAQQGKRLSPAALLFRGGSSLAIKRGQASDGTLASCSGDNSGNTLANWSAGISASVSAIVRGGAGGSFRGERLIGIVGLQDGHAVGPPWSSTRKAASLSASLAARASRFWCAIRAQPQGPSRRGARWRAWGFRTGRS